MGGILASSFVRQGLSPNAVGILGVMVLAASLVSQEFHPAARARDAKSRKVKTQAALREAEDRLLNSNNAGDSSKDYFGAVRVLSKKLAEIQLSEVKEINGHN